MTTSTKPILSGFSFSKNDGLHGALSVIPSVILIVLGHVDIGLALAIGTIPTNQLGIAPKRKQRIIFSILGCLFGIGLMLGSYIALIDSIWVIGLVFFILSFMFANIAAKRRIGVILLSLILPALSVGLGYSKETAMSLGIAFMLGSLWSGFVTLFWPEIDKKANSDGMKAFVSDNPKQYGVMLGLAAVTALFYGYFLSPDFLTWTATATLLTMRPLYDMVKNRGFWRAVATVLGGMFAVITLILQLPNILIALIVLVIMVMAIGTSKSSWWLMPFGTALFILSLSLLGETDTTVIKVTAWERITDNIVGAAIALFYGLLLPLMLKRYSNKSKELSTS